MRQARTNSFGMKFEVFFSPPQCPSPGIGQRFCLAVKSNQAISQGFRIKTGPSAPETVAQLQIITAPGDDPVYRADIAIDKIGDNAFSNFIPVEHNDPVARRFPGFL